MPGYALPRDQGWTYDVFGLPFVVKAAERGSSHGAAVMEFVTAHGEEPGAHVHPTEDEMFYVLEGSVAFRCGDETFQVSTGGFVFLPRGVEHDYEIPEGDPVRLLVVTAPPRDDADGWDGFVASFESDSMPTPPGATA